jgi:imidazolonepropionase-like amidohydrolase
MDTMVDSDVHLFGDPVRPVPAQATGRTVLRARTVVAGASLIPLHDAVVVVEDGVVSAVEPAGPDHVVDVDLGDATVIPGLIDAHVHLASDCGPRFGGVPDQARLVTLAVSNAQRFLRAGVTTVRDLGGPFTVGSDVRDAIDQGLLLGPRLLAANRVITVTGGHGHHMGMECDDVDALRHAVRQLVKDGSDWVKVMASGGFVHVRRSEGDAPFFPLFDLTEMRTVVDEAHRFGMRVAAHCQSRDAIAVAFEAGVDTIEHCTFAARPQAVLDESLVRAIAERGTFVVPTTNNYWLTVGVPWAPKDVALLNLRRLYDLGVRLVAGTDMGIPTTTPDLYAEGLRVFAEIGMPLTEVLATATTQAAEALGIADVTGSITPGLSADLVALDGDPLADVEAYTRPSAVVIRGTLVPLGAGWQRPAGGSAVR